MRSKLGTDPRSSSEASSKVDELRLLRDSMEKSTPFEMGLTEYQGDTWQLMIALTSDPVSDVPEESSEHNWACFMFDTEKWLFLTVELGGYEKSKWSFGFDCNDPEALVFLRQVLREGRLMVGFPGPSRATRLEGVADNLVKKLGDLLELYIPRWKKEFNES